MDALGNEYVAFIGLDWADREHAWCLQLAGCADLEAGFVAQTPEAIERWAAALAQRFGGRQVAVAFEQSRGAWCSLSRGTSISSCTLFIPLGSHTIARASGRPAPKTTRATPNSCWTTSCITATRSGSPILKRLAHYSFWWRCVAGSFGNAGWNLMRGPGNNNWDISITKRFPLGGEQRYLQFRTELFNAWNHTQFSAINLAASFNAAGQQLNQNFGAYSAARDPRIIQLSLRVAF